MPRKPKTPEQIEYEKSCRQMHLDLIELMRTTPEDELSEEDILALLLSYSMRKCDYRAAARRLLLDFGSLKDLLDTPADVLLYTTELRLNTVLMLKGIPALVKKTELERIPKRIRINTPQNAGTYLAPHFIGYNFEQAYLLLVNDHYYPIDLLKISDGYANEVYIDPKRILREAVLRRCTKLVLAHSHPKSSPDPSLTDKITTVSLARMLSNINIQILEHVIVTDMRCYYLSEDEEMDSSILAFSNRKPKTMAEKFLEK